MHRNVVCRYWQAWPATSYCWTSTCLSRTPPSSLLSCTKSRGHCLWTTCRLHGSVSNTLAPPKSSEAEHTADLWQCVVLQAASRTSASHSAAWVQACWLIGSVVNVSWCSLTCLFLLAGCSCAQRRTTPFFASPASSWASRLVSPRPPSTATSARCANPRSVEWWRRAQVGANAFTG